MNVQIAQFHSSVGHSRWLHCNLGFHNHSIPVWEKNKANIILFFVSIKFISNFKCYFVLNFVIQKEKKERKKKKRKKENKESELKIDDHFTLIDSHYKSHFEKTYFY